MRINIQTLFAAALLASCSTAEQDQPAKINSLSEQPILKIESSIEKNKKVDASAVKTILPANWQDYLMKDPAQTYALLVFTDEKCQACRRGATELAKLATDLQVPESAEEKGILIARVDCSKDRFLCNSFRAENLPYIMLVEQKEVFRYLPIEDQSVPIEINAQQLKQWIQMPTEERASQPDAYLSNNFEAYVIEGERESFEKKNAEAALKEQSEANFFRRYVPKAKQLEEQFDLVFRAPIVFMFYVVQKDGYSKFAKVSLFILLVFIPFSVGFLTAFFNWLLDILDPPSPEMIEADKRATIEAKKLGMDKYQYTEYITEQNKKWAAQCAINNQQQLNQQQHQQQNQEQHQQQNRNQTGRV